MQLPVIRLHRRSRRSEQVVQPDLKLQLVAPDSGFSLDSNLTSSKTTHHTCTVRGRLGGGIDYQDTPRVRPCSLFLDVLSRKVLVVNAPTQASAVSPAILFETTGPCLST